MDSLTALRPVVRHARGRDRFVRSTSALSAGMPSLRLAFHPVRPASTAAAIRTPRLATSGRSRSRSSVIVRPGKRLMPRHLEYKLTNSAASRANFETGCRSKKRIDVGDEALFVLHLHRVERAAVGIDADQELVLLLELIQRIVRHRLLLSTDNAIVVTVIARASITSGPLAERIAVVSARRRAVAIVPGAGDRRRAAGWASRRRSRGARSGRIRR